jgi:hypothetical protein
MGAALAPVREAIVSARRAWQRTRPRVAPAAGADKVRSADVAAVTLARLTVLPAVLLVAWLLPGIALLLAGSFEPVPMLLISVPLAVALTVNGLRVVPASWPRLIPGRSEDRPWTMWFGLLGTVAVVAGLTTWQLGESSQALIVVRDPGAYLQTGYWIALHGSLPIPELLRVFGGPHPGLNFASIGFLARGSSLTPAVTPGLPLLLAVGFWAHGAAGASAIGPILGGLAMLAFAGLVARLVGPQWAPAGALVLGLCLPQQYVSRTSLSETALEIMLFGGLCLLADSLVLRAGHSRSDPVPVAGRAGAGPAQAAGEPDSAPDSTAVLPAVGIRPRLAAAGRRLAKPADWGFSVAPEHALAVLAGLALGLGLLISLDAVIYVLPVIPFGCVLIIGRRPQATTFLAGLIVGCGFGLAADFVLDRPFLDLVGPTGALAGVIAVWLVAFCVVAMQLARFQSVRRFVPRILAGKPLRWLPEFSGLLAAAALVGFAVRPYFQTVRGHPTPAVYAFIASLQRAQGLPVQPTRVYSEQTLYWVIWYIGLPTVLLGGFGVAILVRRCVRALITWQDPDRVWRVWALPLAIICAGSAAVLWAPDIVPDQPWASRRLLITALPGLIICGLWAAAWLTRRARDRGARAATAAVAGLFCAAAMLVPTVATTFGLGFSHSGKGSGLKPVVQGLALRRTGQGQIAAVREMCAQIPHNASVVIISRSTAQTFSQTIRGMCDVPVAWMVGAPRTAIDGVIGSISAAGRRPVVLAAGLHRLAGFGGSPVQILDLSTTGDPHELTQLPTAPGALRYVIWMTSPSGPGLGA